MVEEVLRESMLALLTIRHLQTLGLGYTSVRRSCLRNVVEWAALRVCPIEGALGVGADRLR